MSQAALILGERQVSCSITAGNTALEEHYECFLGQFIDGNPAAHRLRAAADRLGREAAQDALRCKRRNGIRMQGLQRCMRMPSAHWHPYAAAHRRQSRNGIRMRRFFVASSRRAEMLKPSSWGYADNSFLMPRTDVAPACQLRIGIRMQRSPIAGRIGVGRCGERLVQVDSGTRRVRDETDARRGGRGHEAGDAGQDGCGCGRTPNANEGTELTPSALEQ